METEIILYEKDFGKRTKEDDADCDVFNKETDQILRLLRDPPRKEVKDDSLVLCLVLFMKNIASDLRGRCACSLNADCSEIKIEIIAKDFSLTKHHSLALASLCKGFIGLQIRFVDGETVLTVRYQNEPFYVDEDFVRSVLFD